MYNVVAGDTFDSISRKRYGTEQYAADIRQANPGASEPLQPGTSLIIPDNPANLDPKVITLPSANVDEVAVLIEGKRFRFWTEVAITRSLDNMDVLTLSAPFEPSLAEFKNTFRPFSFKKIEVTVGGNLLFRGTMVGVTPKVEGNRTVQVEAYSTPGVLNDCTAPASAYPIEYNLLDLKAIAESIIKPFGLKAVFTADVGSAFDRVAMEPGQKIITFLSSLAKQKSLVISSTERGEILFQSAKTEGVPVAKLSQGQSPVVSVTASFNPQDYYSHITGLEPVIIGLEGDAFTVKNSNLTNILRPFTFRTQDTESGTLKEAVQAKAGRMFGNMVSYLVKVNTWRDSFGNLWAPNTIINLQADNAMIYSPYNFLIRSVGFSRDNKSQTASLELTLLGAFNGKIPEVLPWD